MAKGRPVLDPILPTTPSMEQSPSSALAGARAPKIQAAREAQLREKHDFDARKRHQKPGATWKKNPVMLFILRDTADSTGKNGLMVL